MKIIPFLFCCILLNGLANAQTNPALADTLAKMVVTDQQAAGLPPKGLTFDSPQWQHFKDSVFTSHHKRLEKMLDSYGYPGSDMVGEQGAHHFWLLVQHLDKWPAFQQQVIKAMEQQVANKNASPKDLAYLTDRVRLNTGGKQVYGTQVTYNIDSCQAIPKPLEDPASVNERRKAAGLEPLENYLNMMSENHFQMNREMYEKKGIKGPKLYEQRIK